MKNVPNNRKSTRKHESNLVKSLFLILGFDPESRAESPVNKLEDISDEVGEKINAGSYNK